MNNVHYSTDIKASLEQYLQAHDHSSLIVLTDTNTSRTCLPLLTSTSYSLKEISVPAGENAKTLDTAQQIWERLLDMQADRKSLLINLGGGMITDLGGFAAAVFKRGIPFIHIPTSLMGMVDAAIGDKTGLNLAHYKNQIGSFARAEKIFIGTAFLHSLPERELLSGLAEIIKYGLIADKALFQEISQMKDIRQPDWKALIRRCVEIKLYITEQDPTEKGLRKILNFGHTIGHAIEALANEKEDVLLHGEAVAFGMLAEAYLSVKRTGLPAAQLDDIKYCILGFFGGLSLPVWDSKALLNYMYADKKNTGGRIGFSLLSQTGTCGYDIYCSEAEISEALEYLRSTWKH